MTNEEFIRAIEGMTQTLYRVSCTQLRIPADREDAVQETLRRAWEKRHSLREERYMQTWVIRILLNECDRIRRKSARMQPSPEISAVQPPQEQGALKQAILDLEESVRLPILLYYIEGYSVAETARMLHLPQGTVKSRLLRGRRQLRAILEEEVFEP
ncbi:MAG: RNA polymerase sigma factor [Clostridia bacterium]|nr:RNA polymerase sigma factor [Clostridia bacterium]